MEKMTNERYNHLVKQFDERAKAQGYKGKKKLQAQAEFMLGACSILDFINLGAELRGDSAIIPMIAFTIMRGEEMKQM